MGKAVLIMVLGSIAIFGILNLSINSGLTRDRDNSVDNYSNMQLRNICNSTAEILMARLGDNYGYRVSTTASLNILGGVASYTVSDAVVSGDSLVKLAITAKYGKKYRTSGSDAEYLTKTINVFVKRKVVNPYPVGVKAAFTSRNDMKANGNMTIDGRDHLSNGTLVPTKGIYGIWTTETFDQAGACKIGGTNIFIDYAPAKPANVNIIKQNQVYTGDFLDSPDKVFGGAANGFPEGTLKAVAQSGVNGSQYSTDPASISYPLSGVTYLELPSNGSWSPNLSGSGVVVVHNSNFSAALKNMQGGNFDGLIITDDINLYKADMLGAIVSITEHPEDGSIIMGNGSGSLLFSRQAIADVTYFLRDAVKDYGFAKHRLQVKYWYE
jgi:hypothetical protein